MWPENWILFLSSNSSHFLQCFGKSLRNNASSMILCKILSWYFLHYHQRYSLLYSTHVKTLSVLLTLAYHQHQQQWHVSIACHPRHPRLHVTHTGTPSTLAGQQRKNTAHTSAPPRTPRLAKIARHFLKLLGIKFKLLGLKFHE